MDSEESERDATIYAFVSLNLSSTCAISDPGQISGFYNAGCPCHACMKVSEDFLPCKLEVSHFISGIAASRHLLIHFLICISNPESNNISFSMRLPATFTL
jgi:hypothetical protein